MTVWLCVPNAEPAKVGWETVPDGVPADFASVRATAALVVFAVPLALTAVAALLVPVPNVAAAIWRVVVVLGIWNGNSCEWVASALPENVGWETVPAGVPAETALVLSLDPVKLGWETEPLLETVFAPPVFSAASKSASPELNPTNTRPAPKALHVPKPKSVAGLVETALMKMLPTGQAVETFPAGP